MSVLLRRYYQLLRFSNYNKWLPVATVHAIMDAFGNGGLEVIAATNAYLNGIAANAPNRAQALAGFINEDPMMVCSLGLEPQGVAMPIRWLVGNISVADMNLNIFTWCKYKFKYNTSETFFGSRSGGSGTYGLIVNAGNVAGVGDIVRTYMPSYWTTRFRNISPGVIYELECNFVSDTMILNGTSVALQWDSTSLAIATMTCGSADGSYMTSIETNDRIMALSIQNGVIGWVDTLTCNFHAGTGTIEYTLPDGTPWTPSTP